MKWITKGHWHYEFQILMLVVMWCHDTDHYNNYLKKRNEHFRIGRLVIWKDSLWMKCPKYKELSLSIEILFLKFNITRLKLVKIFNDIKIFLMKIKLYFLKKQLVVLEFRDSLKAYLELNKAGLRIGRWEDEASSDNYVRYRFFWKDALIREIPDIVRVHHSWKTVSDGHIERLGKPNTFYNKEFHHIHKFADKDFKDRVGPTYGSDE